MALLDLTAFWVKALCLVHAPRLRHSGIPARECLRGYLLLSLEGLLRLGVCLCLLRGKLPRRSQLRHSDGGRLQQRAGMPPDRLALTPPTSKNSLTVTKRFHGLCLMVAFWPLVEGGFAQGLFSARVQFLPYDDFHEDRSVLTRKIHQVFPDDMLSMATCGLVFFPRDAGP